MRHRKRPDEARIFELDLAAHGLMRWRWQYALTKPALNYQRVLRRLERVNSGRVLGKVYAMVLRLRLKRLSVATGISVPPGVFGPGLSIAHYGSIVVNDGARVGPFCRLHSGVNIGVGPGGVPSIGERVYIGPGAVIYGGIAIGDGAVIGANAVVGRDVPAGITVGGAPARPISEHSSEHVMPESMIDAYRRWSSSRLN